MSEMQTGSPLLRCSGGYLTSTTKGGRVFHTKDGATCICDSSTAVVRAINEGENRYRQTVLGQKPLDGYPVESRSEGVK
jgi:hypothetical protein